MGLDEMIAVVSREDFNRIIMGPGIYDDSSLTYLDALKDCAIEMRRGDAENDLNVVQFVSVFVLRAPDHQFFRYCRQTTANESRLHGLFSVFFGGHIGLNEAKSGELLRELDEEVNIRCPYKLNYRSILFDDRKEVSLHHFGVVHYVDVEDPYACSVRAHDELGEFGFDDVPTLYLKKDDYENWSELFIRSIAPSQESLQDDRS